MLGIRDRRLGILVGLMFLPFALQLLGWARTPLGGGPCSAIGVDRLLLEQPQAFFYAQIMLWGICLLMATGFFLIMLALMHDGRIPAAQANPFMRVALVLAFVTAAIYLLTHTLGLPSPSPLGWLVGTPEPWDVVGTLVLLVLLAIVWLGLRWFEQANAPKLAHQKVQS